MYIVVTIKNDTLKTKPQVNVRQQDLAPVPSTYSIEDVIKNVNPEDTKILFNILAGFLTNEQLEGKRKGLREKGAYPRRKVLQAPL